jgi:YVTN family beta-propeller protein
VANSGTSNITVIDGATNNTTTVTDANAAGTLAVAVNPVTDKVYAANGGSNNLSLIDGATNATVTVTDSNAGRPYTVALNPVTNKIYVPNIDSNNITVIDGATNATTTVTDPNAISPIALDIDPVTNKIYVANSGSNNITVIDGATNATTTLTDPNATYPNTVAVNPVTNKIYVANYDSSNITVVDGATNSTTTVTDPNANGSYFVAVNSVTNRIYIANNNANNVTVIDGTTNATTTVTDPNANYPDYLTVNPVTNKIYVSNSNSNNVTVIDGATNATTTVTDPNANFPNTATVNPATNKIYVPNLYGGSVTVIDGATITVTDPNAITPGFAAVNPLTNKIYVANNDSNNVTVIAEQQVQPIPLVTAITPLTGNQTAGPTATFNFTASSSFAPTAPPPQAVYYQLDTWEAPWQTTSGSSPNFTGTTPPLTAGTHILYAFATDGQDANSTGVAQQLTGSISAYLFNVVPPAATKPFATTTTLISSQNPANPGDSVILTATVTSPDHFWATGTVTFRDGATVLGAGTLDGAAQATFTTTSLALGTHSITAAYGGDGNFGTSTSAALSQDVAVLQSITVSPNPGSVPPGEEPLQFTATGHYADGKTGALTTAVTWSSSNTSIATISNDAGSQGSATGVAQGGPVTITALRGTITGTAQLTVTAAQPPAIVSLTPNSGTGATQTFTVVVSDPSGIANLNQVQLLFNTTPTRLFACNVYYDTTADSTYLYDDTGSGFVPEISNSQCTLSGSAASISGNKLTLIVALTFSGTFTGQKNAYVYAQGNNGLNNGGWVQKGTWTPPVQAPTVDSLSPNLGTGVTQTFTAVVIDPSGLADLNQVQLLFNTTATRPSGCNVYYHADTHAISLYNDTASGFAGSVMPGSATQVSNNQCTLIGSGSSFTTSGNSLAVSIALAFSPGFTGQKNAYAYVQGNNGANNGGWIQKGTWMSPPQPQAVMSLTPTSGTGSSQTFTVADLHSRR